MVTAAVVANPIVVIILTADVVLVFGRFAIIIVAAATVAVIFVALWL